MDFAVLPDATCQGLFHHVYKKVTFGVLLLEAYA